MPVLSYNRPMGMIWVLFDPEKESQSQNLSTEEAQFIIQRLKSKHIQRFLIWSTDWPKWKKLSDFLVSTTCPFTDNSRKLEDENISSEKTKTLVMNQVDPDVAFKIQSSLGKINTNIVELKNLVGKSVKQFDGDEIAENTNPDINLNFSSLTKSNAFSKRNFEDKYKIELLLVHPKGHLFRTTAKDISISGAYNERIIPAEFHNTPFDLVIINNLVKDDEHKRLSFKAQIVIEDGMTVLKYVAPSSEQIKLLRASLKEYAENFKKLTGE